MNKFEETLKGIMANSGCPICGSAITCRLRKRRFGVNPFDTNIEWQCSNTECDESNHWSMAGEHSNKRYYR